MCKDKTSLTVIDFFDSDKASAKLAYARRDALHRHYGNSLADMLCSEERERYAEIGSREYADAWLCGRVVAKELIRLSRPQEAFQANQLQIRSRNSENKGVPPTVWQAGRELPLSLSVSHVEQAVLVALADEAQTRVGVDLLALGVVQTSVQNSWFTKDERAIAREYPRGPAQIWTAKEATYKALNDGESFAPRQVVVERLLDSSCTCRYQTKTGLKRLDVKTWQTADGHLAAFTSINDGTETA